MDRTELIERLELLVREGLITIEEAISIREQFDAGGIDNIQLPLSRAEERQRLFLVLSILAGANFLVDVRRRVQRRRDDARRFTVVDLYEARLNDVTNEIASSRPRVRTWHDEMMSAITEHAFAQAEIGANRPLTERELIQIQQRLQFQAGYLERFADQIAARALVGRPMSEKQIFDRARQYGGFAIGLFYRLQEERFRGLRGWVARYIPVDDGGTCVPCHEAGRVSPYLPGEGPFPGEVCVARGKCRCRREMRFDITAWRILTNNLNRGRLIA